ncbi:ubiquitin-activating enzyme E1 [Tribonema minus]|uniref:E1 ubiquitin-activating enzyme n=1 Tax=Tribonema minus TaxID=303371 RepID=A0A836CIM1_9STRA|nr:ubiquitin-activating enzyme E1 [Tribonema minus]
MEVDESLYSRQLYVMGREAQRRMATSDVLIVGVNGLGVEVAKNVILAGVKSVTLLDRTPASWSDLAAQFYLTEADIGKPRAAACVNKLAELNRYVSCVEEDLTTTLVSRFQVVVLIDVPLSVQLEVDDFCHSKGICCIAADVRGVFASVFCDFGPAFVVSDKNDTQAVSCLVSGVTKDSPALVTVMDDQRHQLETGDVVTFASVEGMPELEGREFTITERGPYAFEINCDTTAFGTFVSGYVNQVKQPVTVAFKPLRAALDQPEPFMETDFAKFGRPGVLHQGFRALHRYRAEHGGALPAPGNSAQADALLALARELNSGSSDGYKADGLDGAEAARVLRALASTSRGVVSPVCAAVGGVVGQEVLKAASGKFMPIRQWLYWDAEEALPAAAEGGVLAVEEVQPQNCRYDGQIMVFGKTLQAALGAQNLFLVGAGAIGCEMLKNWAMMGVGCGPGGAIHVTDMDHIERSNLSRQFLFREEHIGKPKSATAAAAARAMNGDMKLSAHELKCAPDTEGVFNDDFYAHLTGVCTALDNVEARLYMDQKCLFYKKPMFESGTLGTKGNTQVVVPYLTENYGASRDPPEKSIPVCTLKNFPNQIEHTLQWARDWFEGAFSQSAGDANAYLEMPDFLAQLAAQPNARLETLRRVEEALVSGRPERYAQCVQWARLRFEDLFHNTVAQLLHNFPADSMTSSGTPFWSGAKRPPTPVAFDADDPLHVAFVRAAADLRAANYGIAAAADDAAVLAALSSVIVPDFTPAEGVKIAVTEAEAKEEGAGGGAGGGGGGGGGFMMDTDAQCAALVDALPEPASLGAFRLAAVEFDKDVDAHMVLVTAASNLRARCYKIPEADMHRSRLIAGKIIPAIATTTALVTGLVCLELIKVAQEKPLEAYKNWFLNLALPQFACSEPIPPATTAVKLKGREWRWSAWDCIDVDRGDITLAALFALLRDEYGLEVTMLSHGVSILFSFFASKKKAAERLPMRMTQVVAAVTKREVAPTQRYLIFEVCASDVKTSEDVEIPYLRFKLPPAP